jgi:hypothetical protein
VWLSAISLVTSVIAFVGVYVTGRLTFLGGHFGRLHERRLDSYGEAFTATAPLGYERLPQDGESYACGSIALQLRAWYFRQGGLLMTRRTQRRYVRLVQLLNAASVVPTLEEAQIRELRAEGSRFRTALAADVGARRSIRLLKEI